MNYYNEFDRFSAAWLRELQKDGHISGGQVDERSIKDVRGADLAGMRRVHLFAGIGGWDYALRLAGWPDDREVWTGSCPCQSFSCAGKGKGVNDPRHLWPEMFRLIRECRPGVIFGEQVAAAIGHGWLDGVFADLEGQGYACGAAVLPACGVGAPHKRDRIFWVADAGRNSIRSEGPGQVASSQSGVQGENGERERIWADSWAGGAPPVPIPDPTIIRQQSGRRVGEREYMGPKETGPQYCADGGFLRPWSRYSVVLCADGKARRIAPEPEIFPLAHGSANRVGILRGAGNAIVPQVAAEFIKAFMDLRKGEGLA